jgi:HK97 family phage prohead protease
MHDRSEPIGDWMDVREDARGLVVEGQLWTGEAETEASRKALNLMRGTGPKGLSIGYGTKKYEFDQKTGVRTLQDVDLFEVSVVGYGMNPKALVTNVKNLFVDGRSPTIRELEEILRDAGFSVNQAKALLSSGYKGIVRDADALEHLNQESAADEMREIRRLRDALRGIDPC